MRRSLSRCLAVSLITLVAAGRLIGQEDTACNLVYKAWVDPFYGVDGTLFITTPGTNSWCNSGPVIGPNSSAFQQLNDPTQPFKTIQRAVDAVHYALIAAYCTAPNSGEGLVIALPGIYGETPVGGQGEQFPIRMRDRVHVRGLNGRACILRGSNELVSTPTVSTIWPLLSSPGYPGCGAGRVNAVVLVDFSTSGEHKNQPGIGIPDLPWLGTGDTAELLDGFTLQGGDVQVYFGQCIPYRWPLSGRVTNCLFDMRHDPEMPATNSTVRGPWIGILMGKELEQTAGCPSTAPGTVGYFDQRVLIANNTFLMAECQPGETWVDRSRPESVAIIDVTAPLTGAWVDVDNTNRGVGNPIIANNLFRTAPDGSAIRPFAMLGIDRSDTDTVSVSPAVTAPTNVFDPATVGSDNGYFASRPVTSLNWGSPPGLPWHVVFDCKQPNCSTSPGVPCGNPCAQAALPVPAIALWDGSSGIDAGFVGEWLATQLSPPTPTYNDFRLLPGSPLEDLGLLPAAAANGTSIPEHSCQEAQSFGFDHEGWGNPRVVGGRPDVGWDERHGLIVAGSYGNESISHNNPPVGIQPGAAQGRAKRVFIFPASVTGAVQLHGNGLAAATPVPTAWSWPPPGALNPPIMDPLAAADFNMKWIGFSNRCPAPTPWPPAGPVVPLQGQGVSPIGQLAGTGFYRFIDGLDNAGAPDSEGALMAPCNLPDAPRYFNLQAFQQATPIWYSNLQFEYR